MDREQRGVADHSLDAFEALGVGVIEMTNSHFCRYHWPHLCLVDRSIGLRTFKRRAVTDWGVLTSEIGILWEFTRVYWKYCAQSL
jgi:hypothetical protein